jgi:hypothetical protein
MRPACRPWLALACSLPFVSAACRDVASFSTGPSEHFCGSVIQGPFVREGFGPATQMRLRLDANALQSAPGSLTTSDGLFRDAPLKVVPQIFHDPLSTLQFGEGRQRNLLYVVEPSSPSLGPAVTLFLSLMESGSVEVRLLRGAPLSASPAPSASVPAPPIFGVFPLERREGDCGFLASLLAPQRPHTAMAAAVSLSSVAGSRRSFP